MLLSRCSFSSQPWPHLIDNGADPDDVWDFVYLTAPEVGELLEFVKAKDTQSWVYPIFCFAARGDRAPGGGAELPNPDAVAAESHIDLAADANEQRAKLIACQEYIRHV